jgi:hypothetical protein
MFREVDSRMLVAAVMTAARRQLDTVSLKANNGRERAELSSQFAVRTKFRGFAAAPPLSFSYAFR